MELRRPPLPEASRGPDRVVRGLLALVLVALAAIAALVWLRPAGERPPDAERVRELAASLMAAGALDEAALQYERYLEAAPLGGPERARIAFSLGSSFLEQGRYESALRWLYQAELDGAGELADELGRKIVHALEGLGRPHAAQAALDARVELGAAGDGPVRPASDPVVARIGDEEIRRSQVERALDELPPELARSFAAPHERRQFVHQYVADELLWRRARKLEYDRDPEVRRLHQAALRRLAVARLVEEELVAGLEVDAADLENYFAAHRDRYRVPSGDEGEPRQLGFEEARAAVERDYRLSKLEAGYRELVDRELATAGVEIYAERMTAGEADE